MTGAAAFGFASFTPSLLPRAWWVQALVVGLSAAVGYVCGVGAAWLLGAFVDRRPASRTVRLLWAGLATIAVPTGAVALWRGQQWQAELHRLTGQAEPDSYSWVRLLLLAGAVLLVLVLLARGLGAVVGVVSRRLASRMPPRGARALAVVVVAGALVLLNNGLVWRGTVEVANTSFGLANGDTIPGSTPPVSPARSGGPGSLVSWADLGKWGRALPPATAFTWAPWRGRWTSCCGPSPVCGWRQRHWSSGRFRRERCG